MRIKEYEKRQDAGGKKYKNKKKKRREYQRAERLDGYNRGERSAIMAAYKNSVREYNNDDDG